RGTWTATMLRVEHVDAGYGETQVLWSVDLAIEQGEVVALLGSNGAGKSTTLGVISGLLRPWRGRVIFDGEDVSRREPDDLVKRGIAHVPQGRRLFAGLTVEQNLRLGAYLRNDRTAMAQDLRRVVARLRPRNRPRRPRWSLARPPRRPAYRQRVPWGVTCERALA